MPAVDTVHIIHTEGDDGEASYLKCDGVHAKGECHAMVCNRTDAGLPAEQAGKNTTPQLPRGKRERTPSRRVSETLTAKIGGCSHYFTVSRYDDGRPCEVFIVSGKEGSSMRGLYDALGIVLSHYLQIGGDPDDIADKLRHVQFEPAGLVTGAPAGIQRATSPVDALAQYLQTFE